MAGATIYYRVRPGQTGPHFEVRREKSQRRRAIDYDRSKRRWVLGFVRASEVQERFDLCREDLLGLAQDGRCGVCGRPLVWVSDLNGPMRTTIEHVIPQVRGGPRHGNIVKAHRRCNEDKGDRWPTGCEILFLAATNAHLLARAKR